MICLHYFILQTLWFSLLHVQGSLKERVSLKTMTMILRKSFGRHLERNGTPGLLTHDVTLLTKIRNLDLSGESNRAGKVEVKDGRVVVTQNLMTNHVQ